ncbi:hypothetical protein E0Z10_g3780 [Xylaria hypoxylon]|uniref:Uncharacterized protein n=1 Tax=Xylaria hypoxylon TaxID=37992 RepID=A0A4Z0Z2J0_9PEZI|nr:hypothetical protein E0Z10_g3780 [Xylaria hypoxylon]
MAFKNRNPDTARALIPYSNLVGGELVQAVNLGDSALISGIISIGADILWTSPNGKTVLEGAAKVENATVLSLYFSSGGSYQSAALYGAVEAAIKSKDYAIVRLLASHRPIEEIDCYEASSLVLSIRALEWGLASLLLCGPFLPGPSKAFMEPCAAAVEMAWRALGVVKPYWIQPLTGVESNNVVPTVYLTPLSTALLSGSQSLIEEMVSPLLLAIQSGDIGSVRLILDAGANIEFQVSGITALSQAVLEERLDIVKRVLDRGASTDPLIQSGDGPTALQWVAMNGYLSVVKLLLSRGADINALPVKVHGRTALEGAAEHGKLDMVYLLLEMGSKIDGDMGIYYVRSVGLAKREGHWDIANFLKKHGSWGVKHQILHDRPGILDDDAHFRYDKDTDCWDIRQMIRKHQSYDWYSVGSSYCSTDSSPDGSFDAFDIIDGEVEQAEDTEDESEKRPSTSYNTNSTPQTGWDNIIYS